MCVTAGRRCSRFRNKPGLLHRVWDVTSGGDTEDVLFNERPEVQALNAEPDLGRRLALQAKLMTRTVRRTAPLLLMLQSAAGSDPAAAQMLHEASAQRLTGLGFMARAAAATGQLAVSEEECRDLLWAHSDGMLWHRLVVERGWSDAQFAEYLTRAWTTSLVKPGRRNPRISSFALAGCAETPLVARATTAAVRFSCQASDPANVPSGAHTSHRPQGMTTGSPVGSSSARRRQPVEVA